MCHFTAVSRIIKWAVKQNVMNVMHWSLRLSPKLPVCKDIPQAVSFISGQVSPSKTGPISFLLTSQGFPLLTKQIRGCFDFWRRVFYTPPFRISIKIKAICFHTRSVLGPGASSVWSCGPCVCAWLCADYCRVFNGPDKVRGGNILFTMSGKT